MITRYELGWPFTQIIGQGPTRQTIKMGAIQSGGKTVNDCMQVGATGVVSPAYGTFEVLDNDFSTGRVDFKFGDFSIVSNIDYYPGLSLGATATNIAACISKLTGFSATANGAVVTVRYEIGSANDVDFDAHHYGSKLNFGNLTPSSGILHYGSPSLQGPVIS